MEALKVVLALRYISPALLVVSILSDGSESEENGIKISIMVML